MRATGLKIAELAAALAVAVAVAVPALAGPRPSASGAGLGLSNRVLIAAAQSSPVKRIDDLQTLCDGEVTVQAWLTALTRREAKSIAWTAGPCELTSTLNPLDAGGAYCAQATITLKHPKTRRDRPELEIYLENPRHGRPGAAYAFRSVFDPGDGPDYERERMVFDGQWRERFGDTAPRPCRDDR
jgi:hypothetical protein